jgi:hypothetical protein
VNYIPAQGDPGSPVRHCQENPADHVRALDISALALHEAHVMLRGARALAPKKDVLDATIEEVEAALREIGSVRAAGQLRASVALLGEKGQ